MRSQVEQFSWGWRRYASHWDGKQKPSRASGEDEYSRGLYLVSIPSPVESLNALNLKIRQTIAGEVRRIQSLQAIIIDPMGAVDAGGDLRTNLIKLKELAETHRTFVFLLTEQYAFEEYTFIEHYSAKHYPFGARSGSTTTQATVRTKKRVVRVSDRDTTTLNCSSRRNRWPWQKVHREEFRVWESGCSMSIAAQSAYAHERLAIIRGQDKGQGAAFFS